MTGSGVVRARNAVATVFTLNGVAIATWMTRIPDVRDLLGLTPGALGRVLLAMAAGSILALPLAGLVVNRIGAHGAVILGALLCGSGMVLTGLGADAFTSVWVVVVGLLAFGYGMGTYDVAMNVEGAVVERRLGRAIMPRLHAGFSLGTVFGAGLGAVAAAVQVSVAVHLGAVGVAATATAIVASQFFLPATPPTRQPRHRRFGLRAAWREPRTLLIGVLVLTFALSEGAASEWLALGLVDGLGVSNAAGAVGFAVFVSAMTAARLVGTVLIDRHGRVRVLRIGALLAGAGVLLVVFGGSVPVALVGAVAWGLGTALGFPIGMSAGADDPQRAPIRVSVVASIAYTAFLAGPPLLGWLGDHVGVQRALLVVLVAMVVGAVVAGATRPLRVVAGSPLDEPDVVGVGAGRGEGQQAGALPGEIGPVPATERGERLDHE